MESKDGDGMTRKPSELEMLFTAHLDTANLLHLFATEYRFHPSRGWLFDFAAPDLMLAIEIEGGAWVRGRHTREPGFSEDCRKYTEAALLGWSVLRFSGHMVETNEAIEYTKRMVAMLRGEA